MTGRFRDEIERTLDEHQRVVRAVFDDRLDRLERLATWSAETLGNGGKLILFGNGGSAAQAQHLAAEFVNRYRSPRRALAALALTTDGAVLTGIANDGDFQDSFARQIEALGRPEDLALAFSTSGVSPSVVRGLRAAHAVGMRTAALLGRDGGPAREAADLALVVPGDDTARVQEAQLLLGHVLCRWVEHLLVERPDARAGEDAEAISAKS